MRNVGIAIALAFAVVASCTNDYGSLGFPKHGDAGSAGSGGSAGASESDAGSNQADGG